MLAQTAKLAGGNRMGAAMLTYFLVGNGIHSVSPGTWPIP